MAGYRLATYASDQGARAALVVDDQLHGLAAVAGDAGCASVLDALEDWDRTRAIFSAAAEQCRGRPGIPIGDARLLPPVYYPPAIYCAGANYLDHAREMARKRGIDAIPDPRSNGAKPYHFMVASRCCAGAGATVAAPSPKLDWEVELVAVIGRPARNVAAEKALDFVAGYMAGNDLSARNRGTRPEQPIGLPFRHSWIESKGFEHSKPVGPWMVPAEDVGDPSNLGLKTWVNGVLKQDSNTSQMIFSLPEQIAYLSSSLTLHPGDLIFTGTPAGTGAERDEFLGPGDTVEVWVEKIGKLATVIGQA
jgi:2-keto-4-pentenoate hydratase/2-oxohepta-3-ene-1,7-dioic acid hydratase in catechol pathway